MLSNSATNKTTSVQSSIPGTQKFTRRDSAYYHNVKKVKYQQLSTIPLQSTSQPMWNSFFSVSKTNPKLIGFEKRSRKKFRHLFHSKELLIAEADGVIEFVTKEKIEQISLKDTPLQKFHHVTVNKTGGILLNKEKVALVNYHSLHAIMYEFQWQPFIFASCENFWLVGTRETYDGPGELYCFDYNGELKWAIAFTEKFSDLFGGLSFIPYLLKISSDSTDIFVSSMDRLYRLDVNGHLKARIAISELKENELKQKYEEMQRALAIPPKTEGELISMYAKQLSAQFSIGLERSTFTSPFAGFAHDPKTDMIFILEDKGRVSAWNSSGKLQWFNTFKNEGRYISWLDDKLIVSFQSGETFWLNREGKSIYGAKLPKQASTIDLIPNQDKYLIVCEDNRLYELNKDTGNLVTGSEGHPGMELFTLYGQHVFYDGNANSQGYFWLAPPNHQWKHFEAKTFVDADANKTPSGIATEIAATKKFIKKWSVKSKKRGGFGSRIIDFKNERVYAVEEGPQKDIDERMKMSDSERQREYTSHNLVCFDFNGDVLWTKHFYSSMRWLFLSPHAEVLFISIPSEAEITYLPGHIVTLTKDGQLIDEFKVKAHGFTLDFVSEKRAIVHFASEKGGSSYTGVFEESTDGKWILKELEDDKENQSPFGAGLNKINLNHYKLNRIDKKKYSLAAPSSITQLSFSAAIYEAYETPEDELLLRIGTRLIAFYNANADKVREIKEQENIQSVTIGPNSFVVVTKGETKCYNYQGELIWKYAPLPKAFESNVTWIPDKKYYLWVVSNNIETVAASINEKGAVLRSHSFDKKDYYRSIIVSLEDNSFVAQTNDTIEVYNL